MLVAESFFRGERFQSEEPGHDEAQAFSLQKLWTGLKDSTREHLLARARVVVPGTTNLIRAAERFFSGVPQPPPPWRLLPESSGACKYSMLPNP